MQAACSCLDLVRPTDATARKPLAGGQVADGILLARMPDFGMSGSPAGNSQRESVPVLAPQGWARCGFGGVKLPQDNACRVP